MERKTITLIVDWNELELVAEFFKPENQNLLEHGAEHPWFPGFFAIEMSWHPMIKSSCRSVDYEKVQYVVKYASIQEILERKQKT